MSPNLSLSLAQVRSAFLAFFEKQGHTAVPSAPLVPQADPSLLFVNAGMVPFKRVFMGQETRPYVRAASSQKCVRAGGKHNDLEMVGYTKRHHTFFEMLGNFSFGDYFKEDAIQYAWTFLTQTLGIDKDRLWITVYHTDDEARRLWKKIAGVSEDRVISIETNDNFWSMAETGPCGPCTEIFYDHGDHLPGGLPGTPEQDGDRFVEIWNLVFMQYDQQADGSRLALPKPGVDTGIGCERLAAVLQGVDDNYRTDVFHALIEQAAAQLKVGEDIATNTNLKVIADHVRSAAFLMADGVMPGAEGRGYVVRRLIRRAQRHALACDHAAPFLGTLLPTLVELMGGAYPELGRSQTMATEILQEEEQAFLVALEKGKVLLEDELQNVSAGDVLPGARAFRLYDTYGLPVDVLEDVLEKKGVRLDHQGFEKALEEQRRRGKAASGFQDAAAHEAKCEVPATLFVGYTHTQCTANILAVGSKRGEDDHLEAQKADDEEAWVVVDRTPFYAESGGQQGDQGTLVTESGRADVLDTQKQGTAVLHHIKVCQGRLEKGQKATLQVDEVRRENLKVHHSATHLLHAALRQVLGTRVVQKGSLVAPDRLRFDFSYGGKVATADLQAVERLVNTQVRAVLPVGVKTMSREQAMKGGAMALFGEAYQDNVRVVTMAHETDGAEAFTGEEAFSKELCGGTHVRNTGQIGFFKILSETGVAKGIRRIEAVAGEAAETWLADQQNRLDTAHTLVGGRPEEMVQRIQALLDEKKSLQAQLKAAKQEAATTMVDEAGVMEQGVRLLVRRVPGASVSDLRGVWDQLRGQRKPAVVWLLSTAEKPEQTVPCILGVTDVASEASSLFGAVVAAYGGRGGGRADLAQGSVKTDQVAAKLLESLRAVYQGQCKGETAS